MHLGMDAAIRNRGYDTLEDAGDIGGDHESSFGIDEPSAVRRVLRWIDETPAGQRFLVSYLGLLGLRDGRWKLIHELESRRSRLYDLEEDSEEKRDVAGLHPERVEAYRHHLLRWATAQKYRITK